MKLLVLLRKIMSLYKINGFIKQIYDFYKIMCFLLREFMSFCKIIEFTKQMYENKSLSPNHVFTFRILSFTISILLLIIL